MNQPIVHFDTFGTLKNVLRAIEVQVPFVFQDDTGKLAATIKDVVALYADQHNWDLVALSVSRGIARRELGDLVDRNVRHKGPIVIDPTGSTPEHQTFLGAGAIKACRERMVMANESSGDILIILYGLEQIDREVAQDLLMRRLRMMRATIDMMAEEGLESYGTDRMAHHTKINFLRKLEQAQLVLGVVVGGPGARDSELVNQMDWDGNKIKDALAQLVMLLDTMRKNPFDPHFSQCLNVLMLGAASVPEQYKALGFDFDEDDDLRARNARQTPPGATLDNQPKQAPSFTPD